MEWTPITRPMLLHNAKQMKPSAASLDQCKPKKTAYSGIVVYCGHLPCSIHWHRSSTRSRMRRLAGFPQFGLLIPKMAVSRHISVQCTDCGPRRGFLKQAMRLYGDSQCADDIRPWTLLDKGKDGFHPIPLKINNDPRVPFFFTNPIHPWSPWYPGSGHHPGPSWGPFHLGRRLSHDTFKTAFRGFLHVMEKYLV